MALRKTDFESELELRNILCRTANQAINRGTRIALLPDGSADAAQADDDGIGYAATGAGGGALIVTCHSEPALRLVCGPIGAGVGLVSGDNGTMCAAGEGVHPTAITLQPVAIGIASIPVLQVGASYRRVPPSQSSKATPPPRGRRIVHAWLP